VSSRITWPFLISSWARDMSGSWVSPTSKPRTLQVVTNRPHQAIKLISSEEAWASWCKVPRGPLSTTKSINIIRTSRKIDNGLKMHCAITCTTIEKTLTIWPWLRESAWWLKLWLISIRATVCLDTCLL
jgi:hypothetical protein